MNDATQAKQLFLADPGGDNFMVVIRRGSHELGAIVASHIFNDDVEAMRVVLAIRAALAQAEESPSTKED